MTFLRLAELPSKTKLSVRNKVNAMSKLAEKPKTNELYDRDFFLWTREQARLLREKRLNDLDLENLAEEVESVGKSHKHKVESKLELLLKHLLKMRFQPERLTPSWKSTIREARSVLRKLFRDSPSLKAYAQDYFAEAHTEARHAAAEETGLELAAFPADCPFTLDEALDPDFHPAALAPSTAANPPNPSRSRKTRKAVP
jgi:Domain of unknown function DUF29